MAGRRAEYRKTVQIGYIIGAETNPNLDGTMTIREIPEAEKHTSPENYIFGSDTELQKIHAYLRSEALDHDLHVVERELFSRLLALGRTLLQGFVRSRGTGDVGPVVRVQSGESLPKHEVKRRGYLSIFGEVEIKRTRYWTRGQAGVNPLDAELNLPEERHSYLLQEWGTLLGMNDSFDEVHAKLESILGVRFYNQALRGVVGTAAAEVPDFYESRPPDLEPGTEGDALVYLFDGKGVPMRKAKSDKPRKVRRSPGEKPGTKKEAVVSAVHTLAKVARVPEDVLVDLNTDGTIREVDEPRPTRPRPKNKMVRATLAGKAAAVAEAARHLERLDPGRTMELVLVLLTDGDPALQRLVGKLQKGRKMSTMILDIMHVLNYLWEAGYALNGTGTVAATEWVMERLARLLEGEVGRVIGGMRSSLTRRRLTGPAKEAVERAIGYFAKNRRYMDYESYLRRGYPIGTGVVEGACRSLVKDRMERAGMRWSVEGAEAVLQLRSIAQNDRWRKFWDYYSEARRRKLYSSQIASAA